MHASACHRLTHLLAAGVAGAAHAVVCRGGAGPGGQRLGPVDLAGPGQHGITEGSDDLQLVRVGERRRRAGGEQQAEGGRGGEACRRPPGLGRHGALYVLLLALGGPEALLRP